MRSALNTAYLLFATLLVPAACGAQEMHHTTKNKEVIMSVDQQNGAAVRKLYEAVLNKRNMSLLDDVISEDYAGPGGLKGVAGFAAPVAGLIKAFPDVQWHLETLVAGDGKVAVRWKLQGTHKEQFQEYAATGKTVSNDGMAIYELKNGKITGAFVLTDRFGFLQQLGVLPGSLPAAAGKAAEREQVNFIDKFFVPAAAKEEFLQRMSDNRKFIRTLPGFIKDEVFQQADEHGNLSCITVAAWQNKEVLAKAKEAVQAEYRRTGFDPAGFYQRLNIKMDRGEYAPLMQ